MPDYNDKNVERLQRPPDGRSARTLSLFVRDLLCDRGGQCALEEVKSSIASKLTLG